MVAYSRSKEICLTSKKCSTRIDLHVDSAFSWSVALQSQQNEKAMQMENWIGEN